jgi:hypothetical protein
LFLAHMSESYVEHLQHLWFSSSGAFVTVRDTSN